MSKQKFDTPFHINYITSVSEAFNEARKSPNFKLPEGDWWQGNQSVEFYHGFFGAMMLAINGIEAIGRVNGASPESLHAELHAMIGQVANIIVEKAPKIIKLD